MKVLKADRQDIAEARVCILSGGIVAHATETCYGLACDLTNTEAVAKLFAIKERPGDMPVSALFASVKAAEEWVEWNEHAQKLAERFLPGPLTIILPVSSAVAKNALHLQKWGTLGIRISSHPVAQALAEQCECPISTTSANLHGKPNSYSIDDLLDQFDDQNHQPDLILDSGRLPHADSSTVIEITGDHVNVLRQGSMKVD